MVAVKANKQYTITEAEKKSYLAQGYDIIGDNGAVEMCIRDRLYGRGRKFYH